MTELADLLAATGNLLLAISRIAGRKQAETDLPQGEPLEKIEQLPASEPVGNSGQLPATEPVVDKNSTTETAPEPKPKKKYSYPCTCQRCGSEFQASNRDAKYCPQCRVAVMAQNLMHARERLIANHSPAPAPIAPASEDPDPIYGNPLY